MFGMVMFLREVVYNTPWHRFSRIHAIYLGWPYFERKELNI